MSVTELGLPGLRAASVARHDPARPDDPRLIDRFGRVATDLRVSLTDRCNLRCTYCMPAEGLDWTPKDELLTDDEIVRLVGIAVRQLGINEVRFTGGEPLLRKGLESVLHQVSELDPRPEISLTTNGIGLARRAEALKAAGVNRLNVSLDTLRPDRFATITRRSRLSDVLDGMAAARAAGLNPVKVNTVLLRGVNDDEAPALLRYCLEEGYQLRFIEQMPLDAQHGWQRSEMITASEILASLRREFILTPDPAERGGAPAERWLVHAGPSSGAPGHASGAPGRGPVVGLGPVLGTVGVIGSVTRPFCGACDRTRLTADGQLRSCLFARGETDLRALLRGGASDEEIADTWRGTMWAKAAGHGIDDPGFLQPDRPMSAIGG
ncbi:cyclic pyranopterin phosphate synthase [Pseudonocardia eucalypti]|uniref:GTP 3',8-cyclase MoaA n=1 Tax=Pseudonocardia eucalypti TaxID=648755 RepID=UPI0017E6C723|nr:cyclic pyranopterin phosphate synthase [Pseudonocardia eucalypti]